MASISAERNSIPSLSRTAGDLPSSIESYTIKSAIEKNQHIRGLKWKGIEGGMESEENMNYENISQGTWYRDQVELLADEIKHQSSSLSVGINKFEARTVQGPVQTLSRLKFWENFAKVDNWKTSDIFESGKGGRPVLSKFKYLILPIWWSDEDENDPSKLMDSSLIAATMEKNKDYYSKMSFDSVDVSYQILPQTKFLISIVNPGFGDTEKAARKIVSDSGESYDGIILVYHLAQNGPFSGAGGWGNVNGPFTWMSYLPGLSLDVTRHEIGHNFGHPHHISMRGYRQCRGECGLYDGFDMMSGGNHYEISDFHVASKWFFNWVNDKSILLMQPEGPTNHCPSCVSKISGLKMFPFDKYKQPLQPNDIVGVHIPVLGQGNSIYSYWLQYRTGNDGDASIGLSVHFSWFHLGGLFGGSYDQHNYDAHGDTETTFDSFVTPGTCYVIEPSLLLMSIDPRSAEQVVPKVCVDSMNKGSDITISVSFLDPSVVALNSIKYKADDEDSCNINGFSFEKEISNENYLFQIKGTGKDGTVTVGLCSDMNIPGTVYFYDRYPYGPLHLGSPFSYGSFDSFTQTSSCDSNQVKGTHKIDSELGNTWLLVTQATNPGKIKVSFECSMTECLKDEVLENGQCIWKGPDQSITRASSWRLITHKTKTSSGWALDISEVDFYEEETCSANSKVTPNGIAIDSGNAGGGWIPDNAFDKSGAWGGRTDNDGNFWIGMDFNDVKTVKCIEITQSSDVHHASEWTIQAKIEDQWRSVWIERDISHTFEPIQISWAINKTPTQMPTEQPTEIPTQMPTALPIEIPSNKPTSNCFDKKDIINCEWLKMQKKKIRNKICKAKFRKMRIKSFYCQKTCGECSI